MWEYEHWWSRSPAYILFLSIFTYQETVLVIQLLLSIFSVVLLYKCDIRLGWIWCFYPQDWGYWMNTNKETLLLFVCIVAIFYLWNNKWWLVLTIPIIITMFASYGMNHPETKFMQDFWELWKPSFNLIYSDLSRWVMIPAYICLIWLFIKKVNLWSPVMVLVIILSITYGSTFGQSRYREPILPLMIATILPQQKIKNYFIKK
jgi:hypothetical protein